MSDKKNDAPSRDEKRMQELYMELNMANQQLNELQKQIQALEETIQEIEESKKGLNEVSKAEKGKEILVPIVAGIFAKAEIKNSKEFIVNVGANTAVEKSIDDVQTLLDKQLVQMQETQNMFIDNLQKLTVKAKSTEEELKALMK